MQFRLISAFLIISAVALLCGFGAPYIREWDAQRQIRFAGISAMALGVFALTLWLLICLHQRAQRRAGRCLVTIPNRLYIFLWTLIAASSCYTVLVTIIVASARPLRGGIDVNLVLSLGSTAAITVVFAQAVFLFWRRNSGLYELCQNGIIINGINYRSWSRIKSIAWDEALGRIKFNLYGYTIYTVVPNEARDAISLALRTSNYP